MKTGQGFLLVFSITSKSSLAELVNLREEIIRIKDDESVPIVIAGNKADLEDQRGVERAKAFSISQRWEAPYYECSARTRSKSETTNLTLYFLSFFCTHLLTPPPSKRRRSLHRPLQADATPRRFVRKQ